MAKVGVTVFETKFNSRVVVEILRKMREGGKKKKKGIKKPGKYVKTRGHAFVRETRKKYLLCNPDERETCSLVRDIFFVPFCRRFWTL